MAVFFVCSECPLISQAGIDCKTLSAEQGGRVFGSAEDYALAGAESFEIQGGLANY